MGQARVDGDALGSTHLTFVPGAVVPGDYTFAVGTAGSTTLVLQGVLPALLVGSGPSTLTLEGGTHNPSAPPFEYLHRVFLPVVNRLGPQIDIHLKRHGFYPAGAGKIVAAIRPAVRLDPLTLLDRGEIVHRVVRAIVANLPHHIAEREVATATRLLGWSESEGFAETITDSAGPGNVVLVEIASEHATEICAGFGEPGIPAEAVAEAAATQARRYLKAGAPVGCHLADQLLPVMALGPGGSFRTVELSQHTKTNIDVVQMFTGARITVIPEDEDIVRVQVN
jgi:RNA 3'-terminal phosphate cyclase (ATP)